MSIGRMPIQRTMILTYWIANNIATQVERNVCHRAASIPTTRVMANGLSGEGREDS